MQLPPNSGSGAGKTVRTPGKQEAAPKPGSPALQRACSTRSEQWGRLVLVPTPPGDAETQSLVCLAGFGAPSEMRSTPRPRSARFSATTSPSSPWPPPALPRSSLFRFRIQADLLHAEKRRGEVFQGSPLRLAGLRPPRDLTARSPLDLSCRRREPNAEREKV